MAVGIAGIELVAGGVVAMVVLPSGRAVLTVNTEAVVMEADEWSRFQDMAQSVQPVAPAEVTL